MSDILFQRLEKLRIRQNWTWAQVGEAIGVKTAMIMMVKSGKRKLSAKALYRLEQAERAAGITLPLATPLTKAREEAFQEGASNDRVAELAEDSYKHLASADWRELIALLGPQVPKADLVFRMTVLEVVMRGFFLDVGGLASVARAFLDDPDNQEAKEEVEFFIKTVEERLPKAENLWRGFFNVIQVMAGVKSDE